MLCFVALCCGGLFCFVRCCVELICELLFSSCGVDVYCDLLRCVEVRCFFVVFCCVLLCCVMVCFVVSCCGMA